MRVMKSLRLLGVFALSAVGLAVVGCGSSSSSSSGSGSGEKPNVAVFQNTINDFTSVVDDAIKKEVSGAGGTFQEYNAEFNAQEQLTQCQDAITSQRFNVLIVNAVDSPTMVPCAKQAGEAGIKYVALENPTGPSRTEVAPQLPEVQGSVIIKAQEDAKITFNLIESACGGIPKCEVVAEIAFAAEPLSATKKEYFEEQAEKSGGKIEIVEVLEGKYDPGVAVKNTPDALAAHPGVDVFSYESDTSAIAGIKGIESAGLGGKVKVIGDGGSREGVKAIEGGTLFGGAATFPISMGEVAGEMATELAEGKELAKPAVNMYELGKPLEITKANVAEFTPQWGAE